MATAGSAAIGSRRSAVDPEDAMFAATPLLSQPETTNARDGVGWLGKASTQRRCGPPIRGTMVVVAVPGGRTGVLVATKNKGSKAAKKPAAKSLKEKRAAKKAKSA